MHRMEQQSRVGDRRETTTTGDFDNHSSSIFSFKDYKTHGAGE